MTMILFDGIMTGYQTNETIPGLPGVNDDWLQFSFGCILKKIGEIVNLNICKFAKCTFSVNMEVML